MYYLAKLRFESEDDNGKTKKIREQYLVEASSVGEAEKKLMDRFGDVTPEYGTEFTSGENVAPLSLLSNH